MSIAESLPPLRRLSSSPALDESAFFLMPPSILLPRDLKEGIVGGSMRYVAAFGNDRGGAGWYGGSVL